ncbi:pericentriolar material 1 protein isoform X2 [Dendroctonus ponderosae]|uniref:pericentriolar material 1 protein isoform X2 n=1 Tax=Dendroctonus ponderosae TaxID=77166 RepID=UPI002035C131|nr:pericentriolar material 1 protein isoform X2 [Dendroctonus ponderosae]
MADGQGNINRRNTGTVPKIKYSNKAAAMRSSKDQPKSGRMSNNLSPSWHMNGDSANFIGNKGRIQRSHYSSMEVALDGSEVSNGIANYPLNGITPASSSSTSRRNSIGSTLKCDNVTKYPDRRQIEDKLHQIREYLEVTSSLMTNIRNSDEQIFDIDEKTNLLQTRDDLLDSEKKLSKLLEEIDNSEMAESVVDQSLSNADNYSEHSGDYIKRVESDFESFDNELTAMRDQQQSLLNLKQKSENRLMDARLIQDKLAAAGHSASNQVNLDTQKCNKNLSLAEFDTAIRDLEERTKRLNRNRPENEKITADKIVSEMQHLQSQIISMHDANNEREQLIQVLDNRDTELRSQQAQLKKKLIELQTKKEQVDELVMQLQILDEDNQSDVGMQVRNIVTMKDQLTKLKDMMGVVNNMSESASAADVQAATNEICLTAENLQNQLAKPSHKRNDSYVENRLDNHVANETFQKQLNKSQRNQGAKPKQRTASINEKIALQSELEAKKRELEEIMGKHKASTSNLNHDVRGNPVNDMSWKPPIFCQDETSEDRLSSDGDENEYSEVHDDENIIFPQQVNSYYRSNRAKRTPENRSMYDFPPETLQSVSQASGRNVRSQSVNPPEFDRQQARLPSNNQNQEKPDKIQKHLELIKSVCDTVLEQMPNNQASNIQQVRNNITPSSIYAEGQRVPCPPSPFRANQNQVNVFQAEPPLFQASANNQTDNGSYQNWLATNTLQTQSFMLTTLNQCCQMLWAQQREIAQLRNNVNMLQERMDLPSYPQPGDLPPNLHTQSFNAPAQNHLPSNHLRVSTAQKTNQVSAACSMPNLNQYNPVSSNSDMAFSNSSNVPNCALLESCLNNASQHNLMHAANSNLNQAIPAQIWNGQALNNQVAPGNRANNYWDNFRSYSRQNQLSSKNSESSVHNAASSLDRFQLDRINPFSIMTTSKSNSEHSSTNSQETTPRKRSSFNVPSQRMQQTKVDHHGPPPDVLNVNQNLPKAGFDQVEQYISQPEGNFMLDGLKIDLGRALDIPAQERVNISREPLQGRQRNEWHTEERRDQRLKKNRLVDELRESVYKEVASLISANEARPHFLIQLFKDLQKIESDSLRLKILQSIQSILTQSFQCPPNPSSRPMAASESVLSESSEQASIWSKPTKQLSSGLLNLHLEGDEPFLQNSYKDIVSLLDGCEDDVIGNRLLADIKQVFLESDLFRDSVKDTVFLKHFSNVLNDSLEQYRGKKVHEMKVHLIQTIGDLLQGELSFIHLIQETIPESCLGPERKDSAQSAPSYSAASTLFDLSNQGSLQNDNIQNGDLAEADQSRLGESELEDEGAVGGIIESPEEVLQDQPEELIHVPTIDFPVNGEGLDQVPTRLPTKVKSESTTPTKGPILDLLCSNREEPY